MPFYGGWPLSDLVATWNASNRRPLSLLGSCSIAEVLKIFSTIFARTSVALFVIRLFHHSTFAKTSLCLYSLYDYLAGRHWLSRLRTMYSSKGSLEP